jgi:hypothetical protein
MSYDPGGKKRRRPGWYNRHLRAPRYFTVFFAAAGAALCLVGLWLLLEARASSSWPTVPGRVTVSEVAKAGGAWRVRVEYTYETETGRFDGSRIFFGPETGLSAEAAGKLSLEFEPGMETTVYYDPGDSSFSVLRPGPTRGAYLLPLMGLVILGIGVVAYRQAGKYGPEGGGPRDRFAQD